MATERRNITQPADWWAAFQSQAESDGMTLSEWAGECMRKKLHAIINDGLGDRPAAHRPKKLKE